MTSLPRLVCDGREVPLGAGENLLDALTNAGLELASSCRAGACQSCLVQVTHGQAPERAQRGLKATLKTLGYVLACQTVPESDLTVTLDGMRALELTAHVRAVHYLAPDVLRVLLQPDAELAYRAGQFVTLRRADGLSRAYSLASSPTEGQLELHVRVLAGGRMSGWLASADAVGSAVTLRGPAGDCFYAAGAAEQPLVLVGAGTGLAPLWGILRDALGAEHAGAIQLWHGARTPDGLYLRQELAELARKRENFTYHPCALTGDLEPGLQLGRLDQLLLATLPRYAGQRFYLCGDAALVQSLKRALFLQGVPLREIFSDAFLGAGSG